MASAADLMVRVSADMTRATAQLGMLRSQVESLGSTTARVGGRIGSGLASGAAVAGTAMAGAGVAGALAMGAGLFLGAKAGLGFNNSMEQVTAQLNAFTKDGAKSAEILAMIQRRAAATPFAFEEMARATAGLLPAAKASGRPLEEIVELAEILAASNPAEGLEGAAFAIREAVSGDFTSVIERFNLPRQYINDLKKQGVPALEAVRRAMLEMGYDASLVSNMAQTASGRWSTFKDTLTTLAATATAPLFERLSAGLVRMQTVIDANMPALEAFAVMIGARLGAAFDWLAATGVPMVISAFQALVGWWSSIAAAFQTGGIMAAIETGFTNLWALVSPHLAAFGTAVWAWIEANAANVVLTLGRWAAAFVEWIAPMIPPFLVELGRIAYAIGAWIIEQAPILFAKLAEWDAAFTAWVEPMIPPLLAKLGELMTAIGAWITGTALPWIGSKAMEIGTAMVAGIKSGIATAWGAFLTWIGQQLAKIPGPILSLLGINPSGLAAPAAPAAPAARPVAASGAASMGLTLNVIQDPNGKIQDVQVADQRGVGNLKVALARRRGV